MAKFAVKDSREVTASGTNGSNLFRLTTGLSDDRRSTLTLEVFRSDGSSIKIELYRETLLDALVLLYPEDVAYQFEKEDDDEIPF